jgi:O-acetyl-ADP-ribose deacetylase (regulator of RNase III)
MLTVGLGKLTEAPTEYICCFCDTWGNMLGTSSEEVKQVGGFSIQKDSFEYATAKLPKLGGLFTTVSGKLPQRRVIQLVAVDKYTNHTNYKIIRDCLKSVLSYCRTHRVSSLAIPSIESLTYGELSKVYMEVLSEAPLDIYVIDSSSVFINNLSDLIKLKQEGEASNE